MKASERVSQFIAIHLEQRGIQDDIMDAAIDMLLMIEKGERDDIQGIVTTIASVDKLGKYKQVEAI
jgi:hypothetical protein